MQAEAWIYWGALFLILVILKLIPPLERPWAYDPGPAPGEHYPLWDRWSWWHLTVPGIIAAVPFAADWNNGIVSLLAGYALCEGWEFVEGYRSPQDVGFGLASIIVALILTLIGKSVL